jgi:drug/metabolite transporter (DMT)-like permease
MLMHETALFGSIVLTVAAQILLKAGAVTSSRRGIFLTAAGLATFGLVTVMIVYALQTIPLKTLISFTALTYVATPISASIFLKEPITLRQLSGAAIIVVGVLVFQLGG